ncbi:MAG TPA: hypothetical protein VLL97_14570, partial [Acidobacteriota bacterium]|nr:hypothetical protein [Acidobacteriota bacterium]
ARITSLVGNSNREYINDFSLHSYASGGPVSKTEAAQFITKLILEPLECYAPSPLIDEVTKTKPAVVPVRASLAAEKIAKPAPAKSSVTKPAPVEQMKSDREIEVRKNVRLVEFAPTREIPGEIAEMYYAFLPLFEDVLKEHTRDQTDKDNMVIRIAARAREVGSAKTQYPQAQVIAFCRGSTEQYIGYFFLYDFATGGLVNREVTEQFLRKQILEPLKCYLPAADPAAGSQPEAPETQGK